jgi:hypothetical protein
MMEYRIIGGVLALILLVKWFARFKSMKELRMRIKSYAVSFLSCVIIVALGWICFLVGMQKLEAPYLIFPISISIAFLVIAPLLYHPSDINTRREGWFRGALAGLFVLLATFEASGFVTLYLDPISARGSPWGKWAMAVVYLFYPIVGQALWVLFLGGGVVVLRLHNRIFNFIIKCITKISCRA